MQMPSVLCRALGAYWERAPHTALEAHFARTWFHVRPTVLVEPMVAVVPDGYADLQWVNGLLRIAGPDRTVNSEELSAGTVIVGLRFQAGALVRWLGTSAPDLVNGRVALEEFWGAEARRLSAVVSEGRGPEEIAQRLEAALVARVSRVRAPDRAAAAIFRTIGADPHDPTEVTRRLSASLGMSVRTVRRRAVEAFGYGPKTLQRILRFQGFLRAARATPMRSLVDLAMVAGYADQPHLSRQARQLTGMTPTTILGRLP